MAVDLLTLERDVKFTLEKILPDGGGVHMQGVTNRFEKWQSTPLYPIHQGLLKLVAEFYVHAVDPDLRGANFYRQRNIIMEALARELTDPAAVREIGAKRWCQIAERLSSLMKVSME